MYSTGGTNTLDTEKGKGLVCCRLSFCYPVPHWAIHSSSLSLLPFQYLPKDLMKPPECLSRCSRVLQSLHSAHMHNVACTIVASLKTRSVAAPDFSAQFFLVCIKAFTTSFWCNSFPLSHASSMLNHDSQNCCRSVIFPAVDLFFHALATVTRNP